MPILCRTVCARKGDSCPSPEGLQRLRFRAATRRARTTPAERLTLRQLASGGAAEAVVPRHRIRRGLRRAPAYRQRARAGSTRTGAEASRRPRARRLRLQRPWRCLASRTTPGGAAPARLADAHPTPPRSPQREFLSGRRPDPCRVSSAPPVLVPRHRLRQPPSTDVRERAHAETGGTTMCLTSAM